jgi:hypothetical protein
VFERLSFQSKHSAAKGSFFRNSNYKSKGPPGFKPNDVAGLNTTYKRCLSPNHLRVDCKQEIKCWRCKQDGHVQGNCKGFTVPRKSVVIHGESFTGCFSSYNSLAYSKFIGVDNWFKQASTLAGGQEANGPLESQII